MDYFVVILHHMKLFSALSGSLFIFICKHFNYCFQIKSQFRLLRFADCGRL
uniref:Uncharacterized protein n=1 Tax=Octopus bimaculoides TaxID=37653 RepID=A0A0L8GIG4_OCTBM